MIFFLGNPKFAPQMLGKTAIVSSAVGQGRSSTRSRKNCWGNPGFGGDDLVILRGDKELTMWMAVSESGLSVYRYTPKKLPNFQTDPQVWFDELRTAVIELFGG